MLQHPSPHQTGVPVTQKQGKIKFLIPT